MSSVVAAATRAPTAPRARSRAGWGPSTGGSTTCGGNYIRRRIAERVGEFFAAELWRYAVDVYRGKADYAYGFLRDRMTSAAPFSIRHERRQDPSKVNQWNREGYYLHDLVSWPVYVLASVPVMSREEFDALAPIDHRRGLADAPERDDSGLFARVLAACAAAGVAAYRFPVSSIPTPTRESRSSFPPRDHPPVGCVLEF